MQNLISKILQKRGIKKIEDLDKGEKETFDKWEKILTTEEITIETLVEFMDSQLKVATNNVANPDNSPKKDAKLKAMITIYNSLLGIIKSPKVEKETLEKYLEQLLK